MLNSDRGQEEHDTQKCNAPVSRFLGAAQVVPAFSVPGAYIWGMYNSKHFTHRKDRRLRTIKISVEDLKTLMLDDMCEDEERDGTTDSDVPHSSEFVPRWLSYNDAEEWYWRYGFGALYRPVFQEAGKGREPQVRWNELHRFLTAFAWIEPQWRFILDKPCWPLHTEAVDRIVSLYLGVKHYENAKAKAGPREHVDYREMVKYFANEVKASVKKCKIVEVKAEDVAEPGRKVCYVAHESDLSTKRWVESLLHRVIEFDEHLLPPTPVMYAVSPSGGGDLDEPEAGASEDRAEDLGRDFETTINDFDLFFAAKTRETAGKEPDADASGGGDGDQDKEDVGDEG